MNIITQILRQHPELAVFLTIALGFFIGRLKIGSFKLGPMLGSLFAGMVIGQLDISIPPVVKIIFFDLFLFATGYKVGPQFFYGLKKDAFPQLILTVVICTSCLLAAFTLSKLLGYDVGTACGLLAGAFSESTVIGTASEAIQKLSINQEEKLRLINNIPVAYAVTYLVGTTANVWFLSVIAPKLMRVDLREESKKLAKLFLGGVDKSTDFNSAYKEWMLRAFSISAKWNGLSVAEIEGSIPDGRVLIERIRKKGAIIDPTPDTVIYSGDIVVVAARQSVMLEKLNDIGEEVFDKQLLDFQLVNKEIIITKKEIAGKTLRELGSQYGQGIMLNKLVRSKHEMPFEPGTVVNNGDILMISGREADVERTSRALGFVEIKTFETDLIFVGVGIVIGGLIGLLSLTLGGIDITLSTSGGALVMGLVCGWLHSRIPKIGHIPEAALWIFDSLGLAAFLGIVGLGAGPTFISGLSKTGFSIVLVGLVVAILPHIIGLFVGRYILKMNPLVLLGAQAGAGTTTTALKAIQDAAESKLPVLGYTIPYALGNILLTAWGPVLVSLMTR
jgi:putative transport protein